MQAKKPSGFVPAAESNRPCIPLHGVLKKFTFLFAEPCISDWLLNRNVFKNAILKFRYVAGCIPDHPKVEGAAHAVVLDLRNG